MRASGSRGGLLVVALTGVLVGMSIPGGCANNQKVEDESQCKMVKPGTITSVNKMCVVVNDDPVNPAVETVAWKGQQVGFCCNGCKPKWNSWTDEQKDAAVAKAVAASK